MRTGDTSRSAVNNRTSHAAQGRPTGLVTSTSPKATTNGTLACCASQERSHVINISERRRLRNGRHLALCR